MIDILFVCTGNTCRSPMAEALYNALGKGRAASAGVAAAVGMPLSRGAAEALRTRGLSLTNHRARRVDEAMLKAAHRVYVMERAHLDALVSKFPAHAPKISLLKEGADVPDPVGAGPAEYEACAASIEAAVKILAARSQAHA